MRGASRYCIIILSAALLCRCMPPSHLERVRGSGISAILALGQERELPVLDTNIRVNHADTIVVEDPEGRKLTLMRAVKDEDGEMVAHEVLEAARITARFRNVAERHGRIDLRFEIIVPKEMQDARWQLRFRPDMFILEDSTRLESVFVTGMEYRNLQLRGYERYNRFLASIITDTLAFVDWRNVDIFISRNIPDLYRFKRDSTFVTEEEFTSYFDVTASETIRHYTNQLAKRRNQSKIDSKDETFRKMVKAPIETEGIRCDTVLRNADGDFVYHYVQTIRTRPKLRKVDIVLGGEIYEQEQLLYTMNRTEPLTFYISSLSAFVDNTERYMTMVIERRAEANSACYVDFRQGRADIDLEYGNNRVEMGRIEGNMRELLENTKFDIDSITIAASASPEGSTALNGALAAKRAKSIADYFGRFAKHYKDSVIRDERLNSFTVTVGADGREKVGHTNKAKDRIPDIRFNARSAGENWDMLTYLVDTDSLMTQAQKTSFMERLEATNLDVREASMQKDSYYKYMRENLYPRLRTVKFDFFLHRKGMIKDTVHTTVLDTVYMAGVQAIKDRDYERAITLLRPYRDYNTAIAYVSMDYNASAMAILQDLPRTAPVNYMLSLLYARNGNDAKAVEHYLASVKQERSYVFRGNLDPEIYVLIQRYDLGKQTEEKYNDSY